MNRTALFAPVIVGALALAACSGDDDDSADTTTPTSSTVIDKPLVTSERTAPSTSAAPTTTEEQINRMPLTGAVLGDDEKPPQRPALAVKIDNVPDAWPQYGLNQADIVVEEIINDASTRFAAIFHSQDAERVGPIRSGRLQDIDLLGALDRPLFAWSGGNPTVTDAIANSDLVDLGPSPQPGAYYRDSAHDDTTEHTLFSGTPALWGAVADLTYVPKPLFNYLEPDEQIEGDPAAGVEVALDSVAVRWEWNPEEKAYYRFTGGEPHVSKNADGSEEQFSTNNVVVLRMEYVASQADARSPDAVTVSSGPATVFSNGKMIEGTWTRRTRTSGFSLTTGEGENKELIRLTPGRTVLELSRNDETGVPTPIPVPGETPAATSAPQG